MKTRMKRSTPQQLELLFKTFDVDKSGTISFKELATALSVLGHGSPAEKLGFMFDLYDIDGSGSLESTEIQLLLHQMRFDLVDLGSLSWSDRLLLLWDAIQKN
jgi:Ca2+-binding EF-hand superfamily protein